MKELKINQFEKVKKFLSTLEDYSLVYHKDSDGVCSAVLISKVLKEPDFQSPNDLPSIEISDQLFEKINQYPRALFIDLAIDQIDYKKIKTDSLVIDHHPMKNDLNKIKNFIHVNPRFENKEAYIPASYLAYKILEKMGYDVKKYSWIASVGIVGDRGVNSCKDVIELTKKQDKNLNVRELDFISNLIEASKGVRGTMGISESYKIFLESQTPQDIIESKLMNYYHKYQKEINNLMTDFDYHAEYFPETNSYLYEVQSRYNVGGVFSTKISEKNPDAAVFVYKTRSYLFMSARCQTKRINVGNILKEATEDIGKGGGHPQAAGASVPKRHSEEFLEKIRNYLSGKNQ